MSKTARDIIAGFTNDPDKLFEALHDAGMKIIYRSMLYAEFDDVDSSHYPWVISKKAVEAMWAIARPHSLGMTANPGGAEFNGRVDGIPFRCQIHDGDDIENLWALRFAIARHRERQKEKP
jgi:hypothetical protein